MKKPTIDEVLAHPLVQALNPKGRRFMEVRWLSRRLNRFECNGVRMAALIPFTVYPHIKAIPAFQMLLEDFQNGVYADKHTIVVDSSGNTAHAVARLAPAFGFETVKIVLASDVPDSKVGILDALSSVEVIKIPKGVAERAREEGSRPGCVHLNQYGHQGNFNAHRLYTGPEIARVLGANIGAIACAMGSSGTAAGVGSYFKEIEPEGGPKIIGVRPALGEQVPGARDKKRMAEVVTIGYEPYVDEIIDVPRKTSFIGMRQLWSEVEPQPGPTSGLAYRGLIAYLSMLEEREKLSTFDGKTVGFVCADDGRFYPERTTGELDTDQGMMDLPPGHDFAI